MPNTEFSAPPVPPLVEGDRLSREEFERRYDAMPGIKKAELIEGVVHVPSPVNWLVHGSHHFHAMIWLGNYHLATPGTHGGDNTTVRLDTLNEPQPDALLFILPSHGGRIQISSDGYLESAPDLVVEVAASSASYDLGAKLQVYQRNRVREYLVVLPERGRIDWFILRDGAYQPLAPRPDGLLCSETFPGLWLDPAALLAGDGPAVESALRRGLSDPAHAAFVTELARRAGGKP